MTRRVTLTLVGDGRAEYLAEAIGSIREHIDHPLARRILVDDTGDAKYHRELRRLYPDFQLVAHRRRLGVRAAVQSAWKAALRTRPEFVFHTEEDFTFAEPVDIEAMATLLDTQTHLAQVALKRDPYSWPEEEAGGFMELHAGEYRDVHGAHGAVWVENDRLFTSNPSLIPAQVVKLGKFEGEVPFAKLCAAQGLRFGYWGRTTDPPRVLHIGKTRSVGWRA